MKKYHKLKTKRLRFLADYWHDKWDQAAEAQLDAMTQLNSAKSHKLVKFSHSSGIMTIATCACGELFYFDSIEEGVTDHDKHRFG